MDLGDGVRLPGQIADDTLFLIAKQNIAAGKNSEQIAVEHVFQDQRGAVRLILQTEDEQLAWTHGEERRRIRIQRKKDKLDGI